MKKTALMIVGLVMMITAYGGDTERLEELERICAFESSDDLRCPVVKPMPHDIIAKYHITTNQLIADLKSIVMKYKIDEEDGAKRWIRESAVGQLGNYCGTNELAFLATIMTNSSDYAQQLAMGSSINILKRSPKLIDLERGIVTNITICARLRSWTCGLLLGICQEGRGSMYIDDPAQHARIAAFFVEQAGINGDLIITMDKYACELNPWYRHSQQRRDNLARLRPPGLTGNYAEIYDAAQRDAAQED